MEHKQVLAWASLLMLTMLAGCATVQPLNPLSRSHGLPPQYEAESED